jgi:hypothetical protein
VLTPFFDEIAAGPGAGGAAGRLVVDRSGVAVADAGELAEVVLASMASVATAGVGVRVLVAPAASMPAGVRLSHTATAAEATSTARPAPAAVHVRRFIARRFIARRLIVRRFTVRRWARTTPRTLAHREGQDPGDHDLAVVKWRRS